MNETITALAIALTGTILWHFGSSRHREDTLRTIAAWLLAWAEGARVRRECREAWRAAVSDPSNRAVAAVKDSIPPAAEAAFAIAVRAVNESYDKLTARTLEYIASDPNTVCLGCSMGYHGERLGSEETCGCACHGK